MNVREEFEAVLRRVAEEYKSLGEKFAEKLREDWRSVHFDPKRGEGWAQAGQLGRIEFRDSGNDAAVIMTVPAMRFKAHPDTLFEIMELLKKAKDQSD